MVPNEEKSRHARLAAAQVAMVLAQLIISRHNGLTLDNNGVFYREEKPGDFHRYPREIRDLGKENGGGVFLRFHLPDSCHPEEAYSVMNDIEKCLTPVLHRAERLDSIMTLFPLKEEVYIEAKERAFYIDITPFIDHAYRCTKADQSVNRREALKALSGAMGAALVVDGARRSLTAQQGDPGKNMGIGEFITGIAAAIPATGFVEREAKNIFRQQRAQCGNNSAERMDYFTTNIARQFRVEEKALRQRMDASVNYSLS